MYYCFFFNDTATTEIYTLSLHDALPISRVALQLLGERVELAQCVRLGARDRRRRPLHLRPRDLVDPAAVLDRKSTRLNSSHANISYAVFCLKKNKIALILHSFSILSLIS